MKLNIRATHIVARPNWTILKLGPSVARLGRRMNSVVQYNGWPSADVCNEYRTLPVSLLAQLLSFMARLFRADLQHGRPDLFLKEDHA